MRLSVERALTGYYSSLREVQVPATVGVRYDRPLRDAAVGAAAGVLLLLFLISLGSEIELPENAAPIIGADAYAQLYRSEPARRPVDTTQRETWKPRLV